LKTKSFSAPSAFWGRLSPETTGTCSTTQRLSEQFPYKVLLNALSELGLVPRYTARPPAHLPVGTARCHPAEMVKLPPKLTASGVPQKPPRTIFDMGNGFKAAAETYVTSRCASSGSRRTILYSAAWSQYHQSDTPEGTGAAAEINHKLQHALPDPIRKMDMIRPVNLS